jgi:hypothetical protein
MASIVVKWLLFIIVVCYSTIHRYYLTLLYVDINECRQSGLTVKDWCKENGIYVKTYYNRMKKVREELLDAIATGDTAQMQGLAGIGQGLATVPLDLACAEPISVLW